MPMKKKFLRRFIPIKLDGFKISEKIAKELVKQRRPKNARQVSIKKTKLKWSFKFKPLKIAAKIWFKLVGKLYFEDTRNGKFRGNRGEIDFVIYVSRKDWLKWKKHPQMKKNSIMEKVVAWIRKKDEIVADAVSLLPIKIGIEKKTATATKRKDKIEWCGGFSARSSKKQQEDKMA